MASGSCMPDCFGRLPLSNLLEAVCWFTTWLFPTVLLPNTSNFSIDKTPSNVMLFILLLPVAVFKQRFVMFLDYQ